MASSSPPPALTFRVRTDLVFKERVDEAGNEDLIIKDPISGKYFSVSPLTFEVARIFKTAPTYAAGRAAVNALSSEPVPESDVKEALADLAKLDLLEPSEATIDAWHIEPKYMRRALRLNHLDWRKVPTKDVWLRDTIRFAHEGRLPAPLAYRMARKLRSKFPKDPRYASLVESVFLARSFQQRKAETAQLPFIARYMRVQMPLINPDRQLDWLAPRLGWLFSTPFFIVSLAICLLGVLAYRATAPNLAGLLPALANNVPLLFVCTFTMLAIHEYCHALACKHYGGEVREIGVMLLFLVMPAAYADVSDAHLFSSRKQRVLVTFAGSYSSLVLASLGAIICALTETSTFIYQVCFLFMVIGYATVLSNLNPLIPLDGYFMLVDLVGIDNLREAAKDWYQATRHKWFLFCYRVVGATYQTFYLLLTLLMMWGVLVRNLGIVGLAAYGFMLNKLLLHDTKRRIGAVVVLLFAVIAAFVALPVRTTVRGEIVPPPTDVIVAPHAGVLSKHKKAGETVQPGELLFAIEQPELQANVGEERSAVALLRAQIDSAKQGLTREQQTWLQTRQQAVALAVQREGRALENARLQQAAGVATEEDLEHRQQRAAAAKHAALVAESQTRAAMDDTARQKLVEQLQRMLTESEQRLATLEERQATLSVSARKAGRLYYVQRKDDPVTVGERVAWVGDDAAIEVPLPEWLPASSDMRGSFHGVEGPLVVAPTLTLGDDGSAVRLAWLTVPSGVSVFGQHVKVRVTSSAPVSQLESWTSGQFSTMVFDLWRLL